MTRDDMIIRIDVIADTHRQLILGDITRAFEYQVAEAQAKEFAFRQYLGEVPAMVKSWAQASGMTDKDACDSILNEAGKYYNALAYIRTVRLIGKEALKACADEECEAIYQNTIQQIKILG